MKRQKNNNNKRGVTLIEISVAVLIFALVAIPLYYAITYGSNEEIQLDKVAIANRILESFRDEIKNLDFETVDNYGSNIDGSQLPPNSFKALLDGQQKYKDFAFKAEIKKPETTLSDVVSLTIVAEVSWTKGNGEKSTQKISFVKVQ